MKSWRRGMHRIAWPLALGVLALGVPASAAARAPRDAGPIVLLGDIVIETSAVVDLHCHDRDYPIIRCFGSEAERLDEETSFAASSSAMAHGGLEPLSIVSPYVRWYRDAFFGGPSFAAYDPHPDLALIGWDNQISSFVPLYGGHPIWWTASGYGGMRWDWGTTSQSTLGAADNQLSSVTKG